MKSNFKCSPLKHHLKIEIPSCFTLWCGTIDIRCFRFLNEGGTSDAMLYDWIVFCVYLHLLVSALTVSLKKGTTLLIYSILSSPPRGRLVLFAKTLIFLELSKVGSFLYIQCFTSIPSFRISIISTDTINIKRSNISFTTSIEAYGQNRLFLLYT